MSLSRRLGGWVGIWLGTEQYVGAATDYTRNDKVLIPLGYSALCPCTEWGYGIPMCIPQRIAMLRLDFHKKMGTGSDPVPKRTLQKEVLAGTFTSRNAIRALSHSSTSDSNHTTRF